MSGAEGLTTLATVVRTQGRKGEVLCDLLTDFPDQFTQSHSLQLTAPGGASRAITVEQFWMPTGRNAGRVVLKLAGVDSISDAELLRGFSVRVPVEQRVQLDAATFYVADLVGCHLYDGDRLLGSVADVQSLTDSSGKVLPDAAALFVVPQENGADLLIPFANEFVHSIDLQQRSIRMVLPAGLSALNLS